MSHTLVYGSATPTGNSALAKWAASFMPHVDGEPELPFGPCQCVGVRGEGRRLLAVVVFHDWYPKYGTAQISMASASPVWARRETIEEILSIPFNTYKVRKVYTMIPSTSPRVVEFNHHLGFKREANLSEHYGPKVHGVVMGMKRHHYEAMCKRFAAKRPERTEGVSDGQVVIDAAYAA